MTRTPDDLVRMEVHYCVSSLVSTLANAYGTAVTHVDAMGRRSTNGGDLAELLEQAFELACPIDDWEEAAIQESVTLATIENGKFQAIGPSGVVMNAWHDTRRDAARQWCEHHDIEPYQREVYEHWIVSDWLADKLEARGEKVDRDFAGMTVWARTTTGQAIASDSVIESICRDLPGEIEAALAALKSEG